MLLMLKVVTLTTSLSVHLLCHVAPNESADDKRKQLKLSFTGRIRPRPAANGVAGYRSQKRETSEGLGTKRGTRVRFLQQLTGA